MHPIEKTYKEVWEKWVSEFLHGEHGWEFMKRLPKSKQDAKIILEAIDELKKYKDKQSRLDSLIVDG